MSWLVEDMASVADLTIVCGDLRETETAGSSVVKLPMIPRPRLLRFLSFLAANTVWFAFRRPRFDRVVTTGGDCLYADTVYAHFCCAAWSAMLRGGGLLPAGTLRQRLVNLHYRLFLAIAARVEHHIYARASEVIAVSAGVARELERYYGVDAARLTVIPNAVDPRVRLSPAEHVRLRAAVRDREGIPADQLVLLFVAAGDWKRKGLSLLLEALARLAPAARPPLLVVGRDDPDFYAAECRRLGVAGQVHFCGFSSEVEAYYAAADVFVYPSLYEAFPLVVLEAAGAGLPMVVTRISGAEDLVEEGVNGFLVRWDAAEIAGRLERLAADPALRHRMAAAALERSRDYTREAVSSRVLAALEPSRTTI
jgi:UDP-glucose:(heptosyl)LPS alpha-1,3-glucosyltransferase